MRRVLLVDDQSSVLQTLDYVLTLQGYHPLLAASGAAALDLAEREVLDAALIDLHMPGMDGFTVCRTLRERAIARGGDLPVWIMTAAASGNLQNKLEAAGAIGLLRKPFDYPEFFAAVERYCTKAESIRALPVVNSAAA